MDAERKRAAYEELSQKTLCEIQRETALTWAYRAWAARRRSADCRRAGDRQTSATWMRDALEYEHEAIEHAALTGDDALLAAVRSIVLFAEG